MIKEILVIYHDSSIAGHPGIEKTKELICRNFFWEGMNKDIEKYVLSCNTCQRVKPANKTYRLLQPLAVSKKPWTEISVDFVTGLPTTDSQFDTVMVVVCRLSKMVHFTLCKSTWNAEEVAWAFLRDIFSKHGLPENVTSD